jgi:hypothetical protein
LTWSTTLSTTDPLVAIETTATLATPATTGDSAATAASRVQSADASIVAEEARADESAVSVEASTQNEIRAHDIQNEDAPKIGGKLFDDEKSPRWTERMKVDASETAEHFDEHFNGLQMSFDKKAVDKNKNTYKDEMDPESAQGSQFMEAFSAGSSQMNKNEKMSNEKMSNEKMSNEKMSNEKMSNEKMSNEKMSNEKMTKN